MYGQVDEPLRTELRLVASVEVVGLGPVAGRGHRLTTAIASSVTCLGVGLTGHGSSVEVVCLLIPASTSRGRTYSTSKRGLRGRINTKPTLIHGVCGTTVLGEETSRAAVEGSGVALLGREVVKLAGRRAILTPLR